MKTLLASSITYFLLTGCNSVETLQKLDEVKIAPAPQTVSVKISGFRPKPGRIFKQIFVSNFSVKPSKGVLQFSTARDGMSDDLKNANYLDYGSQVTSPYSANGYFSDLMLYLSGIKASQQTFLYCPSSYINSTTQDAIYYSDVRESGSPLEFLGLRDCEKSYLGLDKAKFDFDDDGIPDYLELRCGLNPKNAHDANLAIAGDGVSNLEKCKRNIPVDENANSQPNKLFAYQYEEKLQDDGSTDFMVTNIPVLNGGDQNFLVYYITETDIAGVQTYLYTAYSILPAGSAGQDLNFGFWGLDPANAFNQEVHF